MTPKVRYDPEADAVSIDLSASKTVESEEVLPGVILDFDEQGRIVGIEILRARAQLAPDTLTSAEHLVAAFSDAASV